MSSASTTAAQRANVRKQQSFIGKVASTTVLTAALQPLAYSKVLMQVGYEPFEPRLINTPGSLLGLQSKQLGYPSVFAYCKLIKQKQGWVGLVTTGLFSEVCASLISSATYAYISSELMKIEKRSGPRSPPSEFEQFKSQTTNSLIAGAVCVVVTQPFHVITIRQMASFVGGETAYHTFLSACCEIYSQEGLRGFFAGCAARLFAESVKTALVCSLGYLGRILLRKLNTTEPGQPDAFLPVVSQMAAMMGSTMTYSFSLVSNLMSLKDARLAAAVDYRSAYDCYEQLASRGELKRGAQFFFRVVPIAPISRKAVRLTGSLVSLPGAAGTLELC